MAHPSSASAIYASRFFVVVLFDLGACSPRISLSFGAIGLIILLAAQAISQPERATRFRSAGFSLF